MLKYSIICVLILLLTTGSFAQKRYAEELFDEINMETYIYATK